MHSKLCTVILSALLVSVCSTTSQGAQKAAAAGKQEGALDTSREARDRGPTADQQKENKSDRELTRQIRRAVVQDESLSTMAHQVKIVSVGGMVTLRGAVRSAEEKQSIEAKANAVAGAGKVKNQITVSADNTTDAEANKKASKTRKP